MSCFVMSCNLVPSFSRLAVCYFISMSCIFSDSVNGVSVAGPVMSL